VKKAVTLATVAMEFLDRPGLALTTRKTYSVTLSPMLSEYGSWAIEIMVLIHSNDLAS
jgi:integrase/recombinase XerD